jgi:hypothetical protein
MLLWDCMVIQLLLEPTCRSFRTEVGGHSSVNDVFVTRHGITAFIKPHFPGQFSQNSYPFRHGEIAFIF